MNEIVRAQPQPPAHVEPYVAILGTELTVLFLLTFGGAELSLAADPKGRSRVEALIGYDRAKALAQVRAGLKTRVPLAKPWTARMLAWQGHSVAEIARRLHATDISVRKWLKAV